MKEAKKMQVTDQICKQAQLMRKGGANQTEIGMLLGVNPCTISRIEKAGFDLATYTAQRKERREKEMKKAEEPQRAEEPQAQEEQVPGQIEMELIEKKPQEMTEQVKLMRFQAGQIDKLVLKLDHINDTLNMILRVMRKE